MFSSWSGRGRGFPPSGLHQRCEVGKAHASVSVRVDLAEEQPHSCGRYVWRHLACRIPQVVEGDVAVAVGIKRRKVSPHAVMGIL